MKLTQQHVDFLRAKCAGLIRQVFAEEGIAIGTVFVSVHRAEVELPEERKVAYDRSTGKIEREWACSDNDDGSISIFPKVQP
jgi:hypothetical protein